MYVGHYQKSRKDIRARVPSKAYCRLIKWETKSDTQKSITGGDIKRYLTSCLFAGLQNFSIDFKMLATKLRLQASVKAKRMTF